MDEGDSTSIQFIIFFYSFFFIWEGGLYFNIWYVTHPPFHLLIGAKEGRKELGFTSLSTA